MTERLTDALLDRLLPRLYRIREEALSAEDAHADELAQIEPIHRASARNLIHYLAVRKRDIRPLQKDLMSVGLSYFGVIEPNVLASLDNVIYMLERLKGVTPSERPDEPVDLRTGSLVLRDNADALLGPETQRRGVRIMVTMPSEAATDIRLLEDLLRAGMNVMRVNCAHDSPETWRAMVDNLRVAEDRTGLTCKVQADLAGPKMRTGPISPVGKIRRIRPTRDACGRLVRAGCVWLHQQGEGVPPPHFDEEIPVGAGDLDKLAVGDRLVFKDARGSKRRLEIVKAADTGLIAEIRKTAYLTTGMAMEARRDSEVVEKIEVGELPEVIDPILLNTGDELILTRAPDPGVPVARDQEDHPIGPARIHCTLPEAFEQVRTGETVWFDDGKIGGIVHETNGDEIRVEITHTGPEGAKLRAEKGINFPQTDLKIDALTGKDLEDLVHIAPYVDAVALSFVREPADLLALENELTRLDGQHIGVVLKIENRQAFENLPQLLLTGLRSPPIGVMVARGDLAVEVGFERLSEVQEEILWLCEAAHVPVIWATQILEGLAKKGAPSRAEVTDAAMSHRAECAMLNKGPHIVETTRFLSGILARMEVHGRKRRAMHRRLSVADSF